MSSSHVHAVILAGGSGTRFWPLSRKNHPKQFLSMAGKRSLLQDTIVRVLPRISKNHVWIVTNKAHYRKVRTQVASLRVPASNILLEPVGKNTAPAIAWAAREVSKRDKNAVMVVLPSDHLILHPDKFLVCLDEAVGLAGAGHLVTMGIVPTRPETGYGYLKTQTQIVNGRSVCRVEKFTEKPSLDVARKFLEEKIYLWNSGMFIWKAAAVLSAFEKYLPDVHARFTSGRSVRGFWKSLPSVSIDYGILEKADNVVTVPAQDIGWSDLGSWESLAEVLPKDADGNVFKGKAVSVHSRNSLVLSDKRLVALVGVEDLVIVDTPDALLVCRKDRSQDVRDVVESLKKNKMTRLI